MYKNGEISMTRDVAGICMTLNDRVKGCTHGDMDAWSGLDACGTSRRAWYDVGPWTTAYHASTSALSYL
jgi:hypothetical protein